MRTAGFLQTKHRFFGKTVLSEMPAERCVDIDEPKDLVHAEWLMSLNRQRETAGKIPAKIAGIVFDFDGVMTDNRVRVSANGKESVVCSRSDGWGIEKARGMGLKMAIMSSEQNGVVQERAKKLKIECYHQLGHDKGQRFTEWCAANGFNPEEVIYVGNDENDIACLALSGCGVVPADAHESAKRAAKIILKSKGGKGAVRELIDLIAGTKG
jgi:N-acylneuraminate cytidylyltransferase